MSKYIYVVTIDLDVPIYLTDCQHDFSYLGKTFRSGYLKIKSSVKQKSTPSATDFSLVLSGVDQTMISAFANNPYKGRSCKVERLELDDDETVLESKVWLDGECNSYSYTGRTKESNLTLKLSSIFGAFESVKMINLGVVFRDTINSEDILYWGKASPTTTAYGSGGNGGGGREEDGKVLY